MIQLFAIFVLLAGLTSCVVAPQYGYTPAIGYNAPSGGAGAGP